CERTAVLASDLAAALGERTQATALVAKLTDDLKALGHSEANFRELRETETVAEKARQEAELTLVRARSETAAATEAVAAVARRRAERAAREREGTAAASDLGLHQEVDRAFTPLRPRLNPGLPPHLSGLAPPLLPQSTH